MLFESLDKVLLVLFENILYVCVVQNIFTLGRNDKTNIDSLCLAVLEYSHFMIVDENPSNQILT